MHGSWLGRVLVRLVPPARRDWAEALWTEARQVPPGMPRLAWYAGGVRLVVREAALVRRTVLALAFVAAATWVARAAWPGPASNPATAINRLDVVTLLPVMAGLPLLARWRFGPAASGRMPLFLRLGAYVTILVLMLAKPGVEQMRDNPAIAPTLNSDASVPAKDGMIYAWLSESLFLFALAVYVAVILAITARRSRIAPATLAVGTAAGLMLGAIMYVIAPLGLTSHHTNPWLPAAVMTVVVLLAWVMLFGGPVVAAVMAGRRHCPSGTPRQMAKAKLKQGAAAGFLATGIGALVVAALGTGTVALMPRADWMLHWLYPGQHLLAAVAYNRELTASVRTDFYGLMILIFPVIGFLMGMLPGALAMDQAPLPPPTNAPPGAGAG